MINPKEDKSYYVSKDHRRILLQLITEPTIENNFFLTGGTALSVFYLHHRKSNDLDLFTIQQVDLSEIGYWIKNIWAGKSAVIRESPHFLSCLIDETKIDLVIDPLSFDEKRPAVSFENNHQIKIDTISSIAANKLCTCVSRNEPKDFIDLYFLFRKMQELDFLKIYDFARKKDAIWDDPPTAAFQLEEGIALIKERQEMIPPLQITFDYNDFIEFYEDIVSRVYERFKL